MTYEYICTSCGHEWEATQSINDKPLKKCPTCGKQTAKRQISGGTGFVLKGGGWYADGYGSKPPPAKSTSKSSETDSSAGSTAKKESSSSKSESSSSTKKKETASK